MKMEATPSNTPETPKFLIKGKGGDFRSATEERINTLDTPRNLQGFEYNDLLKLAFEQIEDQKLYDLFVNAIKEKDSKNGALKFATMENELVRIFLELKDDDIKNLMQRLIKNLSEYIVKNKGIVDLTNKTAQEAQTGKSLDVNGVFNVIKCIRSRTKKLALQKLDFRIGFNNRLDAKNSIDLIEIINGKEDEIKEMSLIQVKSSTPDEEKLKKIEEAHRNFIVQLFKKTEIESLETPEVEQMKAFEETIRNHEEMLEIIFETITESEKVDKNKFLSRLKILPMTEVQIAYVFDHFFEEIVEEINSCCVQGYIEESGKDKMIDNLVELRQDLIRISRIPTKPVRVGKIMSVVSVGDKVVRSVEVYSNNKNQVVMVN